MKKMEDIIVLVHGVEHRPGDAVKAGAWRKAEEFNESLPILIESITCKELVDKYAEMIALLFGDSTVTPDDILESIPIIELMEVYKALYYRLTFLLFNRLNKLPNESAPTEL